MGYAVTGFAVVAEVVQSVAVSGGDTNDAQQPEIADFFLSLRPQAFSFGVL